MTGSPVEATDVNEAHGVLEKEEEQVIAAHGLSKWFGDVMAVNDADVVVHAGITALLGPNGAGKTTFMRLVMGLIRPSQGRLQVLGSTPSGQPTLLAKIGYVPEGPAPWADLTGLDCVRKAQALSGLADDGEAALDALGRVGLVHAADRNVGTYSHGMQQRLKFALATLHKPTLLIMDEPLLGTDPMARRDLMQLMRGMAQDGVSILLSTHILSDVEALTDRLILMSHGRILASGHVAEIRGLLDQHPRTLRVAAPSARELARDLLAWEEVHGIDVEDGHLIIRTRDVGAFLARFQDHILATDTPITAVQSVDESVDAIFRYLVK